MAELQADLGRGPVLLPAVAPPAGGDDVVPRVRASATPRDDVIDVLRRPAAVLADVAVTEEDGLPGRGHVHATRHPDVVPEPDHARRFDLEMLRVVDGAVP